MAMNHHAAADCGCADCRPQPLARNNYFTGKLMCERDFTDEQWFFREKIRLHHQRLHGTGVVCGLHIRQHPNPACQNRLVLLEPGSAIDCCGHDILVAETDTFDFSEAPAVKNITDNNPHTLEFCLIWRECPTEDVPVLYDECGCDDTQSAPNRILESYALEVRVDPPVRAKVSAAGTLDWGPSIGIANATAVALDETNQRLFVAAGASPQTIYQVDTQHLLIEASYVTAGTVLSLALAPGGATLYAAVNSTTSSGTSTAIQALSPGATSLTASGSPATMSSGTDVIALTAGPPGLFGIDTSTGIFGFAAAPVDLSGTNVSGTLNGGSSPAAFSTGGTTAWTVSGNTLNSIALPAGTVNNPITLPAAITAATIVAVVPGGAGADCLAIAGPTDSHLHLFNPATQTLLGSAPLANRPTAILITADGSTALVTSGSSIQAINLTALAQGPADAAGPAFPLEQSVGASAMSADGSRIYVPFTGGSASAGGVAVVSWRTHDCRNALRGETCPACDTPGCLVLARVTGWTAGTKLLDTPRAAGTPPSGAAYIDNSARPILASTQALTNALLCLLEQPKPAAPSPVQTIPPPAPAKAKLTHISAISWPHAGGFTPPISQASTFTLALAFDGPVNAGDLVQPSALMVMVSLYTALGSQKWALTWGQLPVLSFGFSSQATTPPGQIPGTPDWTDLAGPSAPGNAYPPSAAAALAPCTALQVTLDFGLLAEAGTTAQNASQPLLVRVLLNGDLVRDGSAQALGLDANHLPPWLGTADYVTGDGIAGGVFESWFQVPMSQEVYVPPESVGGVNGPQSIIGGAHQESLVGVNHYPATLTGGQHQDSYLGGNYQQNTIQSGSYQQNTIQAGTYQQNTVQGSNSASAAGGADTTVGGASAGSDNVSISGQANTRVGGASQGAGTVAGASQSGADSVRAVSGSEFTVAGASLPSASSSNASSNEAPSAPTDPTP